MKKLFLLALSSMAFSALQAEDLETLVKSGNQLFSAGEFEKAKVKYLACLNEKKEEPSVLYNLGNAEFKLMHYQESLTYFQDALKLKPNDYLTRNILYHMGNAQQALAHANMQEKAPDAKVWDEVLKSIESIELTSADKNQHVILKKMINEFKQHITNKDLEKASKCFVDIEDLAKKSNEKNLLDAISKAKGLVGGNKEEAKTKDLTNQIEKVKRSIEGYEESFQSYRKALEVGRKIAIKEGRDIADVGNYIKNNWAIGRERWSLLYEELNRLMKENLKLKDGVADLIGIQEDLYNRLEQVYLTSQVQAILDYNLKVLAEFHADNKQDIIQLEKIADEDLNTKKTELENLKASQKQAQGKNPDQEKVSYEKQEKEIETSEKIAIGLRNVEGFENFIEDGLKKGDLFTSRRYAFQTITFLKGLNDYLNKKSPVDRTFIEMVSQSNAVAQLFKELNSKDEASKETKDSIADIKFKSSKIIQEKLIDIEFLDEQLCLYLEDYIKDGSLKSENDKEQENPESKWLLETLNSFVKTIVTKLVEDLKASQKESAVIREAVSKNENAEEHYYKFKLKIDQQFSTFKNALQGLVEAVQMGVDKLDTFQEDIEKNEGDLLFYQTLDVKLSYFIIEMEKEKTPEAFKSILPFIKQKLQHFQETYGTIFDNKIDKKLRIDAITAVKDDLSKFIFYIDPIKTMSFKFSKLIQSDEEIFKVQENVEKQKLVVQGQIDELKSYFDIIISSLTKQMTEPAKEPNNKDDPKKPDNKKEQMEEAMQNFKKSLSLLNNYEKSVKTFDMSLPGAFELFADLHKVYTFGVKQSALRFRGQPQQAVDTLKLSLEIQKSQKELSKEITDKRWKEQITPSILELIKNFQQENLELIGVRAINQVIKQKEAEEKGGENSQQPPTPNAAPEKKTDYNAAMGFMKEAVNEGDKVMSFYEVKEFSNTPEKHDKVIENLTKAIEILEKKNQDKDKKDDKKEDQNKEQEQQGEPKPQEGDGENKPGKGKEERKPLELTAEQARQLLNDLNKKDEGQKKPAEKKKPINTPRPW